MEAEFTRPFSSAAALGSIEIPERWNAETWRRTADDGQGWERVHRVGGDEKVGEFFITQGPNPSGTALGRDEKVADIFSVYDVSGSAAQLESAASTRAQPFAKKPILPVRWIRVATSHLRV